MSLLLKSPLFEPGYKGLAIQLWLVLSEWAMLAYLSGGAGPSGPAHTTHWEGLVSSASSLQH